MAFISKFKTDTAYSNTDINEVLSAITGKGVLPSSPNDIFSAVSDSGVTLSDKRCEVVWSDNTKTSVKICAGTVIMSDGSYIIISDEILPVPDADRYYVYIYNDIVMQNIPLCTPSLPDDSNSYVLLATVTNGKIADKRRIATSKIASYGVHPVIELSGSFTITKNKVKAGEPFLSFDVGEGYTHAIFTTDAKNAISIFDFESGVFEKSMYASYDGDYHTGEKSVSVGFFEKVYLSYVNGVISLHSTADLYSTINLGRTFYLTVF